MRLLLFILINAFASFFQGVVGFGQGLIASPLSLTILSKGTVLTALIVAGIVLCLFLTRQIKEPLDKKVFTPLLLGSIVGMPFGVVILKIVPRTKLEVFIGVLSILLVVAIVFIKLKTHHLQRLVPVTGFICGVLQTSTGLSGPPVVLLLSGSGIPKNSMRKILVTFFLWEGIFAIPLFLVSRVLTEEGVLFGVCAIPFILLAGYVGNKTSEAIPHKWYKILALLTVSLTGIFAIYSGLYH